MDVGDRRIGMAVSDALGWTAQGIETLERKNNRHDFDIISQVIEKYKPEQIVIGLPRNMNGSVGPQGEKVMAFAEEIRKRFGTDIVFWDERLTTVSAHKAMIEGDVRRERRKKSVDQIAAVLILQSYLDYKDSRKE